MKKNNLIHFGPYVLDSDNGTLRRDNTLVNLPPKVFETLCLLVEAGGEVVSKRALIEQLWPDSYVEERSLTQNVFLLRKTLGQTDQGEDFIQTLSKRGYRLAVPVEPAPVVDASESVAEAVPASSLESRQTLQPTPVLDRPQRRPARWKWPALAAAGAVALVGLGFLARMLHLEPSPPRASVIRFRRLTNDGVNKDFLAALHTDGTRLYFTEFIDGKTYLAQVDTVGGETTRQEGPFPDAGAFGYSKQRNEILFGTVWEQSPKRPLIAMSLAGAAIRPIGDLSAHDASWSPDGNSIAYASGTGLYVASSDGSRAHPIAEMAHIPFWPRWSPDGSRIRFSQNQSGQGFTLWEVRANGENLHRLYPALPWATNACCGDWSPDGSRYVFTVDDARHSALWIAQDHLRPWESDHPVQLAEGPMDFWRSPLFSPDGNHIFALGEQARGELIQYDPASEQFHRCLSGLSTDTVAFSPDGQWVAYTSYPEGILWRMRVDGSNRLQLTDGPEISRFPQWSPDGTQILYIGAMGGKQWKVHRISAQGGKSEVVLNDDSSQGVATWAPDGTRIAFGNVVVFGVNEQTKKRIRILNLKTHTSEVLAGSDGLWTARWSPDGHYLAAVTIDNRKLMLYDFDLKQWTELTNIGINDVIWSRDSKALYFDCENEAAIYRVDMKTRHPERFASLKGIRRAGFFGSNLNIGPDNNLILLREAGALEVYALDVNLP